jgi:hypothetical protein
MFLVVDWSFDLMLVARPGSTGFIRSREGYSLISEGIGRF